jgi:hypothetical protein
MTYSGWLIRLLCCSYTCVLNGTHRKSPLLYSLYGEKTSRRTGLSDRTPPYKLDRNMSDVTTAEQSHVAELMAQIGDRYLLLIRENYLDDPEGLALRDEMARSLRDLIRTGRLSCVYDLAFSPDWREAVVGLHYAILLDSHTFGISRQIRDEMRVLTRQVGDKYENDFRDSTSFAQPLIARPAFLLFALQNRRKFILDFLAAAQHPGDAAEIYAAALVSEELTRGESTDHKASESREHVIALFQSDSYYDADEFANSEQRFRQSLRFWTKADFDYVTA